MSLSNWDLLAFNNDGESCDGTFEAFNATTIEIYKQRILVNNKKTWQQGESAFTTPVLAEIYEGHVNIGGVEITVKHCAQDGVFVFARAQQYDEQTKSFKYRLFAGIGCCAYDNPNQRLAKAMGVDLKKWEVIAYGSGYHGDQEYISLACRHRKKGKEELKEFYLDATPENKKLESQLVGVQKSTYRAFIKWLHKVVDGSYGYKKEAAEWLKKIEQAKPLRFNQGDAYFVGVDKAATEVGSTKKKTIMHEIVEAM